MIDTEKLYKFAVTYIDCKLSNGGPLPSWVYMHYGGNRVAVMSYTHGNDQIQERLRNLARTTVQNSRKRGELDGVVVLGEAWLQRPKYAAIRDVLRPSLDPDRIEVVCAAVWGSEGRKVGVFKIESDNVRRQMGQEIEAPCDDIATWLDPAFQSGAQRMSS